MNQMRCSVSTVLFVALLAGDWAQADPVQWHRVIVDSGGDTCGKWCALAFDPNGKPAIAYGDGEGDLVLAQPNPDDANGIDGSWVRDTVPVPVGGLQAGRLALGFGPTGDPVVAYSFCNDPNEDPLPMEVVVATRSGEGWSLVRTPESWMFFPTVRGRIRLDFDPAGATCVVYGWRAELGFLGTWAGVNYGILSSDPNWHSLVDTWIHPLARDPDPDFVIGPDGYPKVVYGNSEGANQQLFYATCDPYNPGPNGFDFWPREVVHEDEVFDTRCFSPSLRFDGLGRPTIASYLLDGANAGDSSIVWIVRNGLGSWELSPITGDVGRGADHHPDLCLHYRFGHDDNPGISYRGDTVGGIAPLMYAWLDPNDANDTNPDEPDGVWQFSEVDGRAVLGECDKGLYNSLATDPNGMPALAYYDQTWNCLRYAVVAGTPDTYTLATFNEGAGHGGWGTIEREPNLPRYAEGSYVTLTATPSEGKEFLGWVIYDPRYPDDRNYAVEDTNNPTQFLIEYDTRVGAAFACAGEDEVFLLMVAITAVALGIATTRSRNRHG